MKHNNHHYKNQKYCFWHFLTDTIPLRFYRGDWNVEEIWRELHSVELETNVKQKKNIKQQQDIISQSSELPVIWYIKVFCDAMIHKVHRSSLFGGSILE